MGAKKRKSNCESFQSARGGRMFPIYEDMFTSTVGQILFKDAKAFQLYFLMISEYTAKYKEGIFISSSKERIVVTQSKAKEYMTQRTFEKCVDKLIDLGFIKLIRDGYSIRTYSIYGFNDMWQHYGSDKFIIKESWKRTRNRSL